MDEKKELIGGQDGRGAGTPVEVDIPTLKPKEDERKGFGLPLPGGAQAGGAAAKAGGVAAAVGLKAVLTGKLGIAAMALAATGAGLVGYGVVQQGKVHKPRPARTARLGPISTTVKVDKRDSQGSKSLAYMAAASKGEVRWKDPNAPGTREAPGGREEPSRAPAEAEGAAAPAEGLPETPDQFSQGGKLAHNLSGSKLSSRVGGDFGKHNIFSGGTGFQMKDMGKKDKQNLADITEFKKRGTAGGKTGALRRGKKAQMGKQMSTRRMASGSSMGQLKFAGRRSDQAARAGAATTAATYGADAFEQTNTEGGGLEGSGIGEGMPSSVQPVGTGAPDMTAGGEGGSSTCPEGMTPVPGGGCQPGDVEGENVTPYQDMVDQSQQLTSTAKMLTVAGIALLLIGIALIATGWLSAVGWVMVGAGIALLVVAMMMGGQASQMGKDVKEDYGQHEQGEIIEGEGDSTQAGAEEGMQQAP
ncbi:MAG: hypothetical protein ABII00_09625 [Elusimicrobiota bacterium]